MAQVREWHAALKNAIQHSYPLNETWLAAYRGQAQQALRLAGVAVDTAADKNALPFLTKRVQQHASVEQQLSFGWRSP